MMRWTAVPLFLLTAIVTACSGKDKKVPPAQENLFLLFTVSGDSETGTVSCTGQFRKGGPEGAAVALEGGRLLLDGKELSGDSARLAGIYYSLDVPAAGFKGKHQLVIERGDESMEKATFDFETFTVEGEPVVSEKDGLRIRLSGLKGGRVTISVVDTAYATNDVHERVNITKGEVLVAREALSSLKSGPLFLELTRESNTPFTGGSIRGRVVTRYGVSLESELKK
jgi:hypothetical protein